ncbi:beta-glucosidase BglX [Mucilaginibacter polytrichastri]|uniref:Periplasmic beta-glucosidase n=1 Tax=Mucilaginibacter polytrichastri TaxID=1302689 RepID=A0A1Q6A2S2_9SPHI|nr:beta-glucosidase BglX [Mucilaginibacter polytrichastri]OKS88309.1 Periplasmic beta-glucosidase [Mucilaginibacter polytrichastri]SFT13571.1 beta-glucosidase [Mucilaginibacter polytrichastri]
MYYKKISCVLVAAAITVSGFAQPKKVAAPQSKMDQFVTNLMQKMTLEEKIGQLTQYTSDMALTGPSIRAGYKDDIQKGNVGSIFNAYTPAYTRQLQEMAVKNTRLHIPLIFGYDVIHGHKTIFPIPLGESSSWDLAAMEKSAHIAAAEASADGLHWTFAPMVDIARDPRWGRVAEGAGEDVWLGSQIATARVKGFQGAGFDGTTIMACTKHYAGYGFVQGGRDYNVVDVSQRTLWETILPPFKATVDAGVGSFMTSFNEIAGVPATANKWLVNDVLKKQWNYKGFVVTDYTAINEMVNHGNVANEKEAGEAAINAGIDMDMQGAVFAKYLKQSVSEGKVKIQTVNDAVRRVLEAKYKLGLFADPYKYCNEERAKTEIMSTANLDAARDIARKSLVLLKNYQQVLPLKKSGSIALIGPLGDDKRDMIGNWSGAGDWHKSVSLLEGMKAVAGAGVEINYAKGANFTDNKAIVDQMNTQGGDLVTDDPETLLKQAMDVARKADVIVMAVGESQGMTGEAASRSDISIPESQQRLMREIYTLGKPVVLVLMNGRPLTLQWEDAHFPAILETWFAGTEAGNAIADVLFGNYNPAGKLTISFPRSVGQIPVYYDMKKTGRPADPNNKYSSKYLDIPNDPLYPFGYGLSYTNFSYTQPVVDKKAIKTTDKLNVSVTVSNTGNYDGEEVVQLYIRDVVGSVTRPMKQLRNFRKVFLRKGESKEIKFTLTNEDLKFYDANMKYTSEPGDFKVFVGSNSRDTQEADFKLIP